MTAIPLPEPSSFVLMKRKTRGGRILNYLLSLLQQPERARACGSGPKSHTDRRPIDPPPVVELRIFSGDTMMMDPREDPNCKDITFDYRANFFLFATLEQARPIAHGRVHNPAALAPPVLTGMPVSGMAYLDRPHEAGYFLFPDLSVRHEGLYRLTFSLYEETKDEADFANDIPDEDVRRAVSTPLSPVPDNSAFDWRMEIKSAPFTAYSAKKFPGLTRSTALSRTVADQGCRVRIRRDVRMRKREPKPKEAEDRSRTRQSQTPEPYRARSMSNTSDQPPAPPPHPPPFQDPARRPSVPEYPMSAAPSPMPPTPPVYGSGGAAAQHAPGHHLSFGSVKREPMPAPLPQQFAAPPQPLPPPAPRTASPATNTPSYLQGQHQHQHQQQSPYQTPSQTNTLPPLCPQPPTTPTPLNDGFGRRISAAIPPSPSTTHTTPTQGSSSATRHESRYSAILPAPTPSRVSRVPSIDSLRARSRSPIIVPRKLSMHVDSNMELCGFQPDDCCDGRITPIPMDSAAPAPSSAYVGSQANSCSSNCSINAIIEPSEDVDPVVDGPSKAGSKRGYSDTFEVREQRLSNGKRPQDYHHDTARHPQSLLAMDASGVPMCEMTYERASGLMLSRYLTWED